MTRLPSLLAAVIKSICGQIFRYSGVGARVLHPKYLGMSQQPLRLVVFDCDGTLVDSQNTIIAAMTAAWTAHGMRPPSPASVRRVVGLPLEVAIARLAPTQPSDRVARMADAYRDAHFKLLARPDFDEPLYPGVHDVLRALAAAGALLGVATGKGRRGLASTLDRHGLTSKFVTLQTSDRARGKPDPDMLLKAMAETGVRPSNTVMVGDTVYDMEMAANAGVGAVGVSWGYHEPRELATAGAIAVIESFSEFFAIFEDMTSPIAGVS